MQQNNSNRPDTQRTENMIITIKTCWMDSIEFKFPLDKKVSFMSLATYTDVDTTFTTPFIAVFSNLRLL